MTQIRRVAALGGCGLLVLTFQAPSYADATFTHISTPSGRTTLLVDGDTPTFSVRGTASPDVTSVDVVCLRGLGADTDSTLVVSGVPVVSGVFSADPPVPDLGGSSPICRLRALPQGVAPDDPVTAFSGPVLNVDTVTRTTQGSSTLRFRLSAGSGKGVLDLASAGECGDSSLATVSADLSLPSKTAGCVADLGGTVGSLRVDGHPALLPNAVLAFTLETSPLSVAVHTARNGRLTWTESAPLLRCQGTDTFPPPSPAQCGSLLPTGVSFQRTGIFDAGGHQVRLRDSFTSEDGVRHRVRAVYGMETSPPDTGGVGYHFPGHSGGYHAAATGQVVTGLPGQAATILVRSDRFAAEGDPQASTRAITWSRTPTRLAFSSVDPDVFGMTYSLKVPQNGAVRLGFTDSQAILTSAAKRLGNAAAADMMTAPSITSPARGADLQGRRTVVRGKVTAGANGLPVSVTVNGHRATLTTRSASKATYRVVFDEPLGRHRLTAVARDAGGNKRSASITVRNR